ncbi:protein ERGIC-53-like [Discoglossus pictus]
MWLALPSWALLLSLLPSLPQAEDQPAHRRFEYKFSFKGPHVTLPDGDIAFWEHYGDAIPGPDEVRLAPSLKNHRGSIWTNQSASFPHWEVEMSIRISGHGRVGAEGLAVWYTREPGRSGTVYGSADLWDGLGIIFDTYDNDLKGNNPAILVVGNNGKLNYDHSRDGSSQALGSCMQNFRNTRRPFRVKISYFKKTLRVSTYVGLIPGDDVYELCAEVNNMVIPSSGYFGVSAATGVLADDHDVMSFMTYSLSETWEEAQGSQISDSEKEKFQKEFDQFQKELDKQIQDFQKTHPKLDEDEFDSDSQRELEMVLSGQSRVLEELRVLKGRLGMTLEEQKRYRDIWSHSSGNETTTVKKEEHGHDSLEMVMNGMPDLLAMVKDLKEDILKMAAKDVSSSQSKDSDATNPKNIATDVKEDFNKIKRSLQSLIQTSASGQKTQCPLNPDVTSCVSSGVFVTFLLLQAVFTICYMLYRSSKDSGSKKFY